MSTYTLMPRLYCAMYALIFMNNYTNLLAKFNLKSAVYALIFMSTYTLLTFSHIFAV